jgi:hypothetical protein
MSSTRPLFASTLMKVSTTEFVKLFLLINTSSAAIEMTPIYSATATTFVKVFPSTTASRFDKSGLTTTIKFLSSFMLS